MSSRFYHSIQHVGRYINSSNVNNYFKIKHSISTVATINNPSQNHIKFILPLQCVTTLCSCKIIEKNLVYQKKNIYYICRRQIIAVVILSHVYFILFVLLHSMNLHEQKTLFHALSAIALYHLLHSIIIFTHKL